MTTRRNALPSAGQRHGGDPSSCFTRGDSRDVFTRAYVFIATGTLSAAFRKKNTGDDNEEEAPAREDQRRRLTIRRESHGRFRFDVEPSRGVFGESRFLGSIGSVV